MQQVASLNFATSQGQALIVHTIRLIFLVLVLMITVVFQLLETRIVSYETFFPIYVVVCLSFLIQSVYLYFFNNVHKNDVISGGMFVLEALYITALIYFIGVQQSLLIFLFLVNIILCGILYQRRGALGLALLTSILFSFTLSLDRNIEGATAFLAIGVNNLAFFTVAYLSGYLSEQLNVLGIELQERGRDIRALRNLNELILNNMNSGLMTMEPSGLIIQVNRLASKILAKGREQLIGFNLQNVLANFDFFSFEKQVNKSFDYKFGEGEEALYLRMHLAELKEGSEDSKGYILTFQDETPMRALEGRVRQSEKLAAIGQLAAGIAHEIRNPLASISGSIQLMQANSQGQSEEDTKLMNIVSREIDRLNILITEFLDYARPEAPKDDDVDLSELISEIVEFTKLQNPAQTVRTEFNSDESIVIKGNRDKLRQAFLNIVVNAFQAMKKQMEPEIKVEVRRLGEEVVVRISDNGSGIEEKVVSRIFEPFLTTKDKGTGLGLAITHSIIQSHKGEIDVVSEVNKGTTFDIRFPQ